MGDNDATSTDRKSPVRALAATIGVLLLAYGLTGLAFGGADFGTDPAGTVNGETWLGIERNGWTNLLSAGAGAGDVHGRLRRSRHGDRRGPATRLPP